jgi:hypothetical protein
MTQFLVGRYTAYSCITLQISKVSGGVSSARDLRLLLSAFFRSWRIALFGGLYAQMTTGPMVGPKQLSAFHVNQLLKRTFLTPERGMSGAD